MLSRHVTNETCKTRCLRSICTTPNEVSQEKLFLSHIMSEGASKTSANHHFFSPNNCRRNKILNILINDHEKLLILNCSRVDNACARQIYASTIDPHSFYHFKSLHDCLPFERDCKLQ